MTVTSSPSSPTPSFTWARTPRTRAIVAATVVLGALLLATTIRAEQSLALFLLAGLGLAAVWLGGVVVARDPSVPLHRPRGTDVAFGMAIGVVTFGLFVLAAWLARRVDILGGTIDNILETADRQPEYWVVVVAFVNTIAEELFFRGLVMDALPARWAVVGSTLIYAVVIAMGGNVALTLAGVTMGLVFALERRATGSLTVPIATHVTWTLLVVTLFPR